VQLKTPEDDPLTTEMCSVTQINNITSMAEFVLEATTNQNYKKMYGGGGD
jgi:hypothetical protein